MSAAAAFSVLYTRKCPTPQCCRFSPIHQRGCCIKKCIGLLDFRRRTDETRPTAYFVYSAWRVLFVTIRNEMTL